MNDQIPTRQAQRIPSAHAGETFIGISDWLSGFLYLTIKTVLHMLPAMTSRRPPFFIGCGAGFAGDRCDAAIPVVQTLAKHGGPAALMFETLAERTLALAQLRHRDNPDSGWEPTSSDSSLRC